MKSPLLQVDNLDDRREIHYLLGKLPPAARVAYLRWACQQCHFPSSTTHPGVPPDHSGHHLETFFDLTTLFWQYHLDADLAVRELERRVRRLR